MSSQATEKIVDVLRNVGVDFFAMFPCEKVKRLYDLISKQFKHVTLSKEEEGVGICAGTYLAGSKPAMLVQSSGMGNMINALCSLTKTYQLPLLVLVSWRGVYKEKIPAQVPLGKSLPGILRALGIEYTMVKQKKDLPLVAKAVNDTYRRNTIHALLLSPAVWEGEEDISQKEVETRRQAVLTTARSEKSDSLQPVLTRFEIIKTIAPYLDGKIVVCNLGIPCKELYAVKHQKSNFYMLGSMGLASSIGLGISLFTSKKVVVIEGDGSLLANLGGLSTIATSRPRNLTVLAVDNGVHGSTGNQPTAASMCVDLEMIAKALGFDRTYKVDTREEIQSVVQGLEHGPNFVHILAKPGNADAPDIPLSPLQIKGNVMEALRE